MFSLRCCSEYNNLSYYLHLVMTHHSTCDLIEFPLEASKLLHVCSFLEEGRREGGREGGKEGGRERKIEEGEVYSKTMITLRCLFSLTPTTPP